MAIITASQAAAFERDGYLVVEDLLTQEEIGYYRDIYEQFLDNRINTGKFRSDLGGFLGDDQPAASRERITQIMLPGRLAPDLLQKPLHLKTLAMAKELLGEDMDLDFDMLIDKAPFTNTPTPWHQDCAYWISMPDTRAASCWVALDDAVKDNGCMWYVPGSHRQPVRTHRPAGAGGGALMCDADEQEGVAVEIKAGSCIWHHGGTLHYSRGNSTVMRRRAYITNFRPAAMVQFEREQGFDHTGEREVRNTGAQSSK
ncbi:phytanoyl-CoA dioxygenase family protein [Chitinophaga agrisoli]|uniref:Phytanoyl-CoA dioxygenase family protein n=1 Tax=Chitinophaga agrisoli TaxID=2607653 RepID=A0A5B2VKB7_9BACT|nr:phytanoyl-CoA dioxygenase family protein [Chitinophaga agrisoli]KAA2239244.1 phytanoyl-CoA dioxygenase family protein [Chitinophaga agrisoli]